uniref:Putative ovule protein n=1 Tax=Solanum chacoense TaxID=4108 RepID=A0A0V0GH66_SOLCH
MHSCSLLGSIVSIQERQNPIIGHQVRYYLCPQPCLFTTTSRIPNYLIHDPNCCISTYMAPSKKS